MLPKKDAAEKKTKGRRSDPSPNFKKTIDKALVQELLARNCKNLNPPNDNGLTLLVREMEIARRVTILERDKHRVLHASYYAAQQAMAVLRSSLPSIVEPFETEIIFDEKWMDENGKKDPADNYVEHLEAALELVETLLKTMTSIEASPVFRFPVAKASEVIFQDRWEALVLNLVKAYREAMGPTNPSNPLPIHGEGPGGKFISHAISYVTGQDVAPNTVQKKVKELLAREGA